MQPQIQELVNQAVSMLILAITTTVGAAVNRSFQKKSKREKDLGAAFEKIRALHIKLELDCPELTTMDDAFAAIRRLESQVFTRGSNGQ